MNRILNSQVLGPNRDPSVLSLSVKDLAGAFTISEQYDSGIAAFNHSCH